MNDRAIRDAARSGARTPEEVGEACGAGTGCGGCKPAIAELVVSEGANQGIAVLPMILAPEPGV